MIALMAVGGLAMWIANPVLWLWITSSLQEGTQPSMGPYALMLLGIVLTCVAIGKACPCSTATTPASPGRRRRYA